MIKSGRLVTVIGVENSLDVRLDMMEISKNSTQQFNKRLNLLGIKMELALDRTSLHPATMKSNFWSGTFERVLFQSLDIYSRRIKL